MLVGLLALVLASLFVSAAFYVSAVEHPARMALDTRNALAQWKPSFQRAMKLQGALAILSSLLGLTAWWQSSSLAFLAGGLLMLSNWPYTMLTIMPVNRALLATDLASADAGTRALLVKWERVHSVRTALSLAALVLFVCALM